MSSSNNLNSDRYAPSDLLQGELQALASETSARYRKASPCQMGLADTVCQDLAPWITTLAGLPHWVAEAVADIFRDWLMIETDARIRMIQSFLPWDWDSSRRPPGSGRPVSYINIGEEAILELLKTTLTGEHRDAAVTLFDEALEYKAQRTADLFSDTYPRLVIQRRPPGSKLEMNPAATSSQRGVETWSFYGSAEG